MVWQQKYTDKALFDAGMGTDPDTVVAERVGCTVGAVWGRRKKLGIHFPGENAVTALTRREIELIEKLRELRYVRAAAEAMRIKQSTAENMVQSIRRKGLMPEDVQAQLNMNSRDGKGNWHFRKQKQTEAHREKLIDIAFQCSTVGEIIAELAKIGIICPRRNTPYKVYAKAGLGLALIRAEFAADRKRQMLENSNAEV